jgi:hypothetical protein
MAYRPSRKYAALGLFGAIAVVALALVAFGEDLLMLVPLG